MSKISNEELDICMGKLNGWTLDEGEDLGNGYSNNRTWTKDGKSVQESDSWGRIQYMTPMTFIPSLDLNQAFKCGEKVCPETHLLKLFYDARGKVYRSFFQTEKVSYEYFFGVPKEDKSPARAVCLAVRAFVEAKK